MVCNKSSGSQPLRAATAEQVVETSRRESRRAYRVSLEFPLRGRLDSWAGGICRRSRLGTSPTPPDSLTGSQQCVLGSSITVKSPQRINAVRVVLLRASCPLNLDPPSHASKLLPLLAHPLPISVRSHLPCFTHQR